METGLHRKGVVLEAGKQDLFRIVYPAILLSPKKNHCQGVKLNTKSMSLLLGGASFHSPMMWRQQTGLRWFGASCVATAGKRLPIEGRERAAELGGYCEWEMKAADGVGWGSIARLSVWGLGMFLVPAPLRGPYCC